ncbi:hypothetical protein FJY90_08275, partial [Candidatus Gottesmanbacteria bacterium]|nr:hypothetical protein [Candidatus Gottesmanbacteria bacterium]
MDQTAPESSLPNTPLPQNNPSGLLPFLIKRWFLDHKKIIISLLLLLGIMIAGIFVYFQSSQQKPAETLPSGKKIGTIAFASDITLQPEKKDSLGVDPKSAFILSSKNPIDENKLRTSLNIEPQQNFNLVKVNEKEYKIAFGEPLMPDKIYKFKLAKLTDGKPEERTGKDLSWAFQIRNKFRIISSLPRDKATFVPVNSGIEVTFSHENYQDPAPFFSILPKVDGRLERHKRTVSFVPKKLDYGTVYKVVIKKGLGLEGSSEVLGEDYSFAFETQVEQIKKEESMIGFIKEISEFSSDSKPVLSVYTSFGQPLSKLNISVYKLKTMDEFIDSLAKKDTIPSWASYNREIYKADTSKLEKVLSFEAPLQKLDYNSYFIFPQTLAD